MKKLLLLIALTSAARAWAVEPDKQLHFITSYALAMTLDSTLKRQRVKHAALKANLITLGLGALKELTDPQFSPADFNADCIGVLTFNVINLTF